MYYVLLTLRGDMPHYAGHACGPFVLRSGAEKALIAALQAGAIAGRVVKETD